MIKIRIHEPDEYASGYTHWDAELSDSSFDTDVISEEKWEKIQDILKVQNVCQKMLEEIFSPILRKKEEKEEEERLESRRRDAKFLKDYEVLSNKIQNDPADMEEGPIGI